jgi:hypothetical protein
VRITHIGPNDYEAFGKWLAAFEAALSHDWPGEPGWQQSELRAEAERLALSEDRTVIGGHHDDPSKLAERSPALIAQRMSTDAPQGDTLALAEHRGHRLGTPVKVGNLRRLAEVSPATTCVSTWNADENAPMIALNEALGCEVRAVNRTWEKRLGA